MCIMPMFPAYFAFILWSLSCALLLLFVLAIVILCCVRYIHCSFKAKNYGTYLHAVSSYMLLLQREHCFKLLVHVDLSTCS